MKTSAQRWEKTGAVPLEMANYLAEELKTTLAVLQGALPEPAPSRVDEIESRLQQLIAAGPSPELVAALEYYKEDDKPARELASLLTARLEAAQLSQEQEEFEYLAALTGFSAGELRQPMSDEGFWMLMSTGHLGQPRSEILSGVADVLYVVRTELRKCLEKFSDSDAQVLFLEEKHWFRVTLVHPRLPQLTRTLRFVRCQPNEGGLQWTSPTWLDRYWLDELLGDAYVHANFVTGFDSLRVPANCTNLRLAITKNPRAQEREEPGAQAQPEIIAIVEGSLADLPPATLESFRREGNAHHLVVNWLAADLWEQLLPFMAEWPLECWSFALGQACIEVRLDVPYRLYATSKVPPRYGKQLSVILVEQLTDGGHKPAPWRKKSVARIHEMLANSLHKARDMQAKSSSQLPIA